MSLFTHETFRGAMIPPTHKQFVVETQNQLRRGSRQKPFLLAAWTILVYAFLYLPIFVLITLSFNKSKILSLPFKGLTFDWYSVAFADSALKEALQQS